MIDQWYFARGGASFGPYSVARLKELAAAGQIRRGDTVWKEGMSARVLAARVKHLFAAPPPAAVTVAPNGPAIADPTPEPGAPADIPAAEGAPDPGPAPVGLTALAARLASPEGLELAPGEAPVWAPAEQPAAGNGAAAPPEAKKPAKANPPPAPEKPRPRRVLSVKGGVLASQDGHVVRFRKQCLRCGQADTSTTTMPIRPGTTRVSFYCPRCKKNQPVEIQAVS